VVDHNPSEKYEWVTVGMMTFPIYGKSPFFIGKPSINGPFPMAILNNQRVINESLKPPTRISLIPKLDRETWT